MNAPKAQHWLPQVYLRSFCTRESEADEPRLWVFFRSGPQEPRRMRTDEVAAQNYLYSPLGKDGSRDHTVERKLSDLESVLGSIWPHVSAGTIPLQNPSVRKILALFVSTLYLRNPQRLREHQLIRGAVLDLLAEKATSQRIPSPPTSGATTPQQDQASFLGLRNSDLQTVFSSAILGHATRLAELLLPKQWAVVAADAPVFATCDAPVIVQNAERVPFAFGTSGTAVHFPLSPTRYLIIQDSRGLDGYYIPKPGFTEAMNYQVWTAADRYLLSSRPSDELLRGIMAFDDQHGLS